VFSFPIKNPSKAGNALSIKNVKGNINVISLGVVISPTLVAAKVTHPVIQTVKITVQYVFITLGFLAVVRVALVDTL
jgi:hypothetical protein